SLFFGSDRNATLADFATSSPCAGAAQARQSSSGWAFFLLFLQFKPSWRWRQAVLLRRRMTLSSQQSQSFLFCLCSVSLLLVKNLDGGAGWLRAPLDGVSLRPPPRNRWLGQHGTFL